MYIPVISPQVFQQPLISLSASFDHGFFFLLCSDWFCDQISFFWVLEEEEGGGEGADKIDIRLWRRTVYRTVGPSSRLTGREHLRWCYWGGPITCFSARIAFIVGPLIFVARTRARASVGSLSEQPPHGCLACAAPLGSCVHNKILTKLNVTFKVYVPFGTCANDDFNHS
jgi:hypothetical protein